MGKHEFHDRQSPGDDAGDTERLPDPTEETAAPASLTGVGPPADDDVWGTAAGADAPAGERPEMIEVALPDVQPGPAIRTDPGAPVDTGRPYIDRPGRLYMSATVDPGSGEIVAAPPGSPGGVIPDPDRPADLDDADRLRAETVEQIARIHEVPPSLLGVDGFGAPAGQPEGVTVYEGPIDPGTFAVMTGADADAGTDVTERHDPGDPEQYAGEPVDDGWGGGS